MFQYWEKSRVLKEFIGDGNYRMIAMIWEVIW